MGVKTVQAMTPLESTTESPILFLHHYLQNDGKTILKERFSNEDEPDYKFDSDRNIIIAQGILPRNDKRGELLDEETNTREYTITFKSYLKKEFQKQLDLSKELIRVQSPKNTTDQNERLYRQLLTECLDIQKWIDSQIELSYSAEIENFISKILTYIWRKFNRQFPAIPEIKQVRKYFNTRGKPNATGFRLKPQPRNGSIDDFYEYLKGRKFISQRTKKESVVQFLKGQIPHNKINWKKGLHELAGFISQLCDDSILLDKPKQPWKHMDNVFKIDGEILPENWQRNHNKLKSDVKRAEIARAIHILKPRTDH